MSAFTKSSSVEPTAWQRLTAPEEPSALEITTATTLKEADKTSMKRPGKEQRLKENLAFYLHEWTKILVGDAPGFHLLEQWLKSTFWNILAACRGSEALLPAKQTPTESTIRAECSRSQNQGQRPFHVSLHQNHFNWLLNDNCVWEQRAAERSSWKEEDKLSTSLIFNLFTVGHNHTLN